MSIPDAWTTDRVDFNGRVKIANLVTGIKDVGAAKVKNLAKSSHNHKSSSRSNKVLQLQAKHFSDKPVVRINGQEDKSVASKPPVFPGTYFMPSENPTATLLTQLNVGTNRLTDTQAEYLESVQMKTAPCDSNTVPTVDVSCGGFFASGGIPNDILSTKRAFLNESQSRERKQTALRKSQSMAIRQSSEKDTSSKPHPRLNSSTNSGASLTGKSLCYHESFKRGGDLLPVYDKSEIDASNDQIDLMLPGVVTEATPRKSSTRGSSSSVLNSRTPNCCSCCSVCDGPTDFRFVRNGTTPTLNRKSINFGNTGTVNGQQCDCKQCHQEENGLPKKLVQYRHGDVIKTYDWLTADSQETAL